jgi:hypothetical protein
MGESTQYLRMSFEVRATLYRRGKVPEGAGAGERQAAQAASRPRSYRANLGKAEPMRASMETPL